MNERQGIVYALRMRGTNFAKVGFTMNLESRIQRLQTGNPNMLDTVGWIAGTQQIEHQIHQHLEHRACVGEWFYLDDNEVVAALSEFGEVQR